jgi:hypothetical protein
MLNKVVLEVSKLQFSVAVTLSKCLFDVHGNKGGNIESVVLRDNIYLNIVNVDG